MASEIYEILQSAGKEEAAQADAAAASCRRKAQFFLGSNNKRAKTVVLHIDGLDDSVSVPFAQRSTWLTRAPKSPSVSVAFSATLTHAKHVGGVYLWSMGHWRVGGVRS